MGGSNRSGNDQALNLLFFCGHLRPSVIASRICLKSFRAKPPLPSEKKSPSIHLSYAEESIGDSVRTLLLIIDLQILMHANVKIAINIKYISTLF